MNIFKSSLLIAASLLCSVNMNAQNGLSFDGVDDAVDCGNDPSVQISGTTITLEAWIYPTGWQPELWRGSIINKEIFVPQDGYTIRCGNNGQLNFTIGGGTFWSEITAPEGTLSLDTWQHVTGTYDGVTQRLYVDGVEVTSSAATVTLGGTSAGNLTIGGNSMGGRYFIGTIDEAKIWNTARTPAEIMTDMNSTLCESVLPMTGLQAYYRFDQGIADGDNATETNLEDFSGNGNTGELQNMALTGTFSNWVDGYDAMLTGFDLQNITVTSCDDYTVPSGDETYGVSGIYMDTVSVVDGCDILYTIDLTIGSDVLTGSIDVTTCDTYTVPSGDDTYTTSGTYTDMLTTDFGCDSLLTINLTITASTTSTIDVLECAASYTVPSGEETYTTSGTYTDVIPNAVACDSVITINLTFLEATASTIDVASCGDYTSPSGGAIYGTSGVYTDVIPNAVGCDSVITINLTVVDGVNSEVVSTDPTLTAVSAVSGVTYQWIDCDNGNAPILGATEQSYTPEVNGEYGVMVTNGPCSEMSDCFIIATASIEDEYLKSIALYPNPTNGEFTVQLDNNKTVNQINIRSIDGKLIQQIAPLGQQQFVIDLDAPAGIYIVELISDNEKAEIKLVKE